MVLPDWFPGSARASADAKGLAEKWRHRNQAPAFHLGNPCENPPICHSEEAERPKNLINTSKTRSGATLGITKSGKPSSCIHLRLTKTP
jgi:hypothetical protein